MTHYANFMPRWNARVRLPTYLSSKAFNEARNTLSTGGEISEVVPKSRGPCGASDKKWGSARLGKLIWGLGPSRSVRSTMGAREGGLLIKDAVGGTSTDCN